MIKKVIVPTSYTEINLFQFMDYMEDPEDIKRKIAIFLNLDYSFVNSMEDEYIEEINNDLDTMLGSESGVFFSVSIEGIKYDFIPDLGKITLGEFIDINTYIIDINNWHKLISILYRRMDKDGVIEEYNGTADVCEIFYDMPMSEVNGAVSTVLNFLAQIQDRFPEIYNNGTNEGLQAQNYFSKWGWYATVKALANDNIENINKVLNMNVFEVHTYLAADIDEKKFKHSLLQSNGNGDNTIQL